MIFLPIMTINQETTAMLRPNKILGSLIPGSGGSVNQADTFQRVDGNAHPMKQR